jgi:signal transduction histidine kinase
MRRPPLADIAIAVALTIAGQLNLWLRFDGYYPGGPRALNVVLTLIATGALAFRRQWPMAVFGIEFVTFPLARTLGAGMTFWGSFVPFFVATGTVASEESRRRRYLALVLPFVGLFMQMGRPGAHSLNDVAFFSLVLAVAFGLGDAIRRFRERALTLARRTVELELEKHTVVTTERTRIARELHDVISHNLSVAVLQTAGAERLIAETNPQAAEALRRAQEAGREALAEMQLMLGVLRSDAPADERAPQPSLAHLDALVAQVREAGLPVELSLSGEMATLPAAADLNAYRIVQEALTNVLKHAPGAQTSVEITCAPAAVEIAVTDFGGSAPASNGHSGGHGLVGMRERVQMHGGVFEAGARRGGGFAVRATLPLEAQ